jgi:dihydrofolate reductase
MNTTLPLSLIVAVASNGVIGHENRLPWHLPAELKYFKAVTLGKPVIMGRKTWDSLGRPLPGRLNLVVSRQTDLALEGAETFTSLNNAVTRAHVWAEEHGASEIMLIGGAQLFIEALPVANRFYLTRVELEPEGDVYFPAWNEQQWQRISRDEHPSEEDRPAYALELWERKA